MKRHETSHGMFILFIFHESRECPSELVDSPIQIDFPSSLSAESRRQGSVYV